MNPRDEERRARWLAGDLPHDERKRLEAEAVESDDIADSLYSDVAIDESLREMVQSNVVPLRRRWRPGRRMIAASVVAAAVVLIALGVMFFPTPGDEPAVMRSGEDATLDAIEPKGDHRVFPRRFVWHGVVGAESYRWELYDTEARRVGVEVVTDTVLARTPSQTPADSVGIWRWLVIAIQDDGAEGPSSDSIEFSVTPSDPDDGNK